MGADNKNQKEMFIESEYNNIARQVGSGILMGSPIDIDNTKEVAVAYMLKCQQEYIYRESGAQQKRLEDLRSALLLLLDQVDYNSGSCRPNEMVGAVLPVEIIHKIRNILDLKETFWNTQTDSRFVEVK
jgi:hypothetical protein